MLTSSKKILEAAKAGHFAVPSANFVDAASLKSHVMTAEAMGLPLIIGLAESHFGRFFSIEEGASHQCCEDIALMSVIPGMTVMSPADDVEARKMVFAAAELDGPCYIRFGRAAVPVFHDEDYDFQIGKGEILKEGTDVAIIANGVMTYEAIQAAEELEKDGIHARVINIGTIKPIDEEIILAAARDCKKIITCEEHSVIGGLGAAVAEVLEEKCPVPIRRIGVQDEFGHSGAMKEVMEDFGLCASNIVKQTKDFLS